MMAWPPKRAWRAGPAGERGAGWRSVRYKRTVSLEFTCARAWWLVDMSALNPRSPSGPGLMSDTGSAAEPTA